MQPRILIVGAGPTGLTLACQLYAHGVPCRIVDAAPARHAQSRATDLQARTLEVFQDMGVLGEVRARGKVRNATSFYLDGERFFHLTMEDADTPFPFAIGLEQHETEAILEARLEALGGGVEYGVRLTALSAGEDSVAVVLESGDGAVQPLEVAWLLVLPIPGPRRPGPGRIEDEGTQWLRISGPIEPERIDRDPSGAPILDAAACQRMVRASVGTDVRVREVGWTSAFSIHHRIVPEYRQGRVFLAGDAAHIHSPITGQGMNLGIQDAYNLGWKLALVALGRSSESLLDSYSSERRPVARAVMAMADDAHRMTLGGFTIGSRMRYRLVQFLCRIGAIRRRLVAIGMEIAADYRGSSIVDEYRSSVWAAPVTASLASEDASLRQRHDFAAGPRPGERAPDATLEHARDGDGAPRGTLFELLAGPSHDPLLFDGEAPTPEGYRTMAGLARDVHRRWGRRVKVHVITPRAGCPDELDWTGSLVADERRALHARYGASAECCYLIRPDGYVGFRAQPADPVR